MIVPDSLIACLKIAIERDLDIAGTVLAAFEIHMDVTGEPIDVEDDEEGEALVEACFHWVADEVLNSLILKGVMEFSSIDEDGTVYYGLTDKFKNSDEA